MLLHEAIGSLRIDLKDPSSYSQVYEDAELARCIERSVADLSRFLPREQFYETTLIQTVTAEAFTSASAHGTYATLANRFIKPKTETVTDAGATTTYTRDTDYTIDYTNGKITTVSTGSMAVSTAYKITYTKQYLKVDLSSLTDLIRVHRVEYPTYEVPQHFCSFDIFNGMLTISDDDGQKALADKEHIVVQYDSYHTIPTSTAAGSYPLFLDNTVLHLASAYAILIYVQKQNLQAETDLASARTALGSATTAQGTLTAVYANIVKYLNNNSNADAVGLLAAITTDAAALRTAVGTALDAANAYADSVAADLTSADGVWTDLTAYLTGATAPSMKKYLEDGDDKIDTFNFGKDAASVYATYAQVAGQMVTAYDNKRSGYHNTASARYNAAMVYINEAAQRLTNLSSYIQQSEAYTAVAQTFTKEAETIVQQVYQYIQQANLYITASDRAVSLASKLSVEASNRRSEVYSIWSDRKQYIGQLANTSGNQSVR